MARKQAEVKQEETKLPFDAEALAEAIEELSEGTKKLLNSRLGRRTIVLLLHDASGVMKRDIERILDALPELSKRYLRR